MNSDIHIIITAKYHGVVEQIYPLLIFYIRTMVALKTNSKSA
jgi:hypothetical protein